MSLRDEVDQVNQEFSKAVSNQDLDGVLEIYTPDAKLLPPGSPMLEGTANIRSFFQMMIDAGARAVELETVAVDGNNDLVVDVGRYRLTMEPPGADPIVDVGKYVDVMKRQPDGRLRFAYDIFNSDQAPPGA
ncbi:MAG TPA: SgcJ/EcaC family oxidoreductase [Acidimicrobiales bacterium]